MKDRPKLGRGLGDVSQYFLSGASRNELQHHEVLSPVAGVRSIGVCHPGSSLMQAFFLSNLALEISRRRHQVTVRDLAVAEVARVSTLMRSVLSGDGLGSPGKAVVRMYGLPEIEIIDGDATGAGKAGDDDAAPTVEYHARFHLVNTPGSLKFILEAAALPEYIVMTKTDENALLQAYAYIKVMGGRDSTVRIHLVLDDASASDDAVHLFRRFSRIVETHLHCTVNYLGTIVPDEHLHRSISEAKPLVLFQGRSDARDAVTGICSRFMDAPDTERMEGQAGS